ncbi:MAG: hypothetical protein AB1Z67_07380 [Candidatus Limnocylindrales bacterium]
MALASALAVVALPGASAHGSVAGDPAALPGCAELEGAASESGEVTSPWEAVLDDEGAVTGHRLTLRHEGVEHRLRTGRRGFAVHVGPDRLLIGQRGAGDTRLDMIDTSRVCRLWTRRAARLLHPGPGAAAGTLRLTAHAGGSGRYLGTHVLDPESGETQAVVEEPCLENCHPNDGDISAAALSAAVAVRPTPNFGAGGWPEDERLTYRWKSGAVPPSWAKRPLKAGALDASRSSSARSPEFAYDDGAANAVAYSGTLAGFCGSAAIACAGRAMPSWWGVWIRAHGTDFSWGTLRWCQKTSSSAGCFDLRRVMLHELGHIAGLDHPSSAGFRLAAPDSVMQAITPMRPHAGASRHAFGRCDVATLQELYDTPDNKTSVSTCNDVATKVSLSASRWTVARGGSVKLVATLEVADQSAYRKLAANPLNGRSVKLKYRRAGSDDAWKTVWMRSTYRQGRYEATLTPSATWELKAVFSRPDDEGLRYSRSQSKKVKVTG